MLFSSSSEEEEEEDLEEEEEEEKLVFKSDHEFSPESDIEEADAQPIKRARTAKKGKLFVIYFFIINSFSRCFVPLMFPSKFLAT